MKAALAAKSIMDRLLALVGIVVLSPILALIAVAVKLESTGPVFFTQFREGLNGTPFRMYKFRTMVAGADRGGLEIQRSDPRITRLGKVLRSTSLDELPQLFHVLSGRMSIVGPRPLLSGTTRAAEARRLTMKPGMTSYPVLFGRHRLDWEERMPLDLWYVDHWSLALDVRIMIGTIPVVLSRRDVYDREGGSRLRRGAGGLTGEMEAK